MSSLKKVYVAANAVDAHMLEGLLEQEGIRAVVRGDDFVPLQGGALFSMEIRPSVWVFNDEHLPRAYELAGDFGRRPAPSDRPPATWTCGCGERIEEQFSACWSCGRPRTAGDRLTTKTPRLPDDREAGRVERTGGDGATEAVADSPRR